MKTYFIVQRILPPFKKHRYLREGKMHDYLGQILVQKGIEIPDKTRTPGDLDELIPPFNCNVRGVINNTPLSLQIMQLDLKDSTTHPKKLAELLAPYNIEIEWK